MRNHVNTNRRVKERGVAWSHTGNDDANSSDEREFSSKAQEKVGDGLTYKSQSVHTQSIYKLKSANSCNISFLQRLSTAFPHIEHNKLWIILQRCTYLRIHTNFPVKITSKQLYVDLNVNHLVEGMIFNLALRQYQSVTSVLYFFSFGCQSLIWWIKWLVPLVNLVFESVLTIALPQN